MGEAPALPAAKPSDPEDVSWALSTAQTSMTRGDPQEALKWLRRAAEAASEADQDDRALELAKAVADLAAHVSASRPPPAPPQSSRPAPIPPAPASAPAPASSRPAPPSAPPPPQSSAPAPASSSPSVAPRPGAPRPPAAHRPSSAPRAPGPIHALTGKRARMAIPEAEPTRKVFDEPKKIDTEADRVTSPPPVVEPVEKTDVAPKPIEQLTRTSNMDELERMPTQTIEGDMLPDFDEHGSTRVGAVAFQATVAAERGSLPIMAAARVHLVRDPNGTVRATIAAVEGSVAVLVVPIEPGTDLTKLFG